MAVRRAEMSAFIIWVCVGSVIVTVTLLAVLLMFDRIAIWSVQGRIWLEDRKRWAARQSSRR